MKSWGTLAIVALYQRSALGTFVFLTFFDGYRYTWWNWLIVVPINGVLSQLWPLYWLIFRPILS